jgi:hypothetical protein
MNAPSVPFRRALLAVLIAAGAGLLGCVHQANEVLNPTAKQVLVDLQNGMTESDVTSLVGEPQQSASSDTDAGHVDTWTYRYETLVLRIEGLPGSIKYDHPQQDLTRVASPADPDQRKVVLTFTNGTLSKVEGP